MTARAYHIDDDGIRAVVTDLGLEKFSGPTDPGFPPTADPMGFDAVAAAVAEERTDGVAEERRIAELATALRNLVNASSSYRWSYEHNGDADPKTGRAWDVLRRAEAAGDAVLERKP